MNLKNNTHRMHHITLFSDEKFINFLGRGTALPQTPPPSPPTAPRFSRLRRSTCDPPNVPVALTPMSKSVSGRDPDSDPDSDLYFDPRTGT